MVLLALQTGVLLPLHLIWVNLSLILVVVATLTTDFDTGLGIAAISGVLLDLISGSRDGTITLSMLVIFLLLYWILHSVVSREPNQLTLLVSVAGATCAYFLLYLVFNGVSGLEYFLGAQMLLTIILNVVFTYPVLQYYLMIEKLIPNEKSV